MHGNICQLKHTVWNFKVWRHTNSLLITSIGLHYHVVDRKAPLAQIYHPFAHILGVSYRHPLESVPFTNFKDPWPSNHCFLGLEEGWSRVSFPRNKVTLADQHVCNFSKLPPTRNVDLNVALLVDWLRDLEHSRSMVLFGIAIHVRGIWQLSKVWSFLTSPLLLPTECLQRLLRKNVRGKLIHLHCQ